MAQITGGEMVVRTLRAAGVHSAFGLHGFHVDTIFQGCRANDIALIDVRHEGAAGHAAEGYARASGSLGVAILTAGPGFTNVVTSIVSARVDRTPILYLCGSAATRDGEINALQAVDQLAIAAATAKWAHRVLHPSDLSRMVAQAIRVALSSPQGPVVLDLPRDVLQSMLEDSEETVHWGEVIAPSTLVSPPVMERVVEGLQKAERPVLMIGGGGWAASDVQIVREFVKASGVPVYSDFAAHGVVPGDDESYGGTFHRMAELNDDTGRPDLVLAVGVRFGLTSMGMNDRGVPHAAKLIHVESDARELGRLRVPDLAIEAERGPFLAALSTALQERPRIDRKQWRVTVRAARDNRRARLQAECRSAAAINPLEAVTALVENIPSDTIVVGDGGETYLWMNEVINQSQPNSYITHGFLGAMGPGLGWALGAQQAFPDRPVLLFTGDGAVGFHLAELDTMARHDLPIVTVVLNNACWGASAHLQERLLGREGVFGTILASSRYEQVATALGCEGQVVDDRAALGPAIREAFRSRKPTCINVLLDQHAAPPEIALFGLR